MKKILLAMLLVTLCHYSAFGQRALSEPYGDRVIHLPETSQKWFFTVVYSGQNTPRDQHLKRTIQEDYVLRSLVAQTNFREYTNDSSFIRRSDWAEYLGTSRPALLLQKPADANGRGSVVYFASGPHLHTNANLAVSIRHAVQQHMEDCPRCPRPRPQPQPQPVTPVQPIPQTVPVLPSEPEPQERETYIPWWAWLFPALGAGFGVWSEFKREGEPPIA